MKRIPSPPLRGGERCLTVASCNGPLLGGVAAGRGGYGVEPVDARSEMSLVNGLQNKMRNGRILMHAHKRIALLLIFCLAACPPIVNAAAEQGRQGNLIGDLLAPLQKLVSHDPTRNDNLEYSALAAEPQVESVWTLQEAVNRAMLVNPDVLASRERLRQQEGVVLQLRAERFPLFTASAGASKRDQDLVDRSPSELFFPPSEQNVVATERYDFRIRLSYLLYDGSGRHYRMTRQNLVKRRLLYETQLTAYRTAMHVEQTFDSLLLWREVERIHDNTVNTFRQLAENTRRRHELGEITQLDTLRVQTELKNAEADAARTVSDMARSEGTFRRLLMLSHPTITDSLIRIDGAFGRKVIAILFPDAVAIARQSRLDLQAAETEVLAAQAGLRAVDAQSRPRIEVFTDYGVNSSYYDVYRALDGWTLGLSGTWHLWNGRAHRGRLQVQEAELNHSLLNKRRLEFDIETELRELYASLEQYDTVIAAQESAVAYGHMSMQHAERLYEIGQVSIEEVLNAELALRRSQLRLQEAIFRNNASVTQIKLAMGGTWLEPGVQ